MPRRAPVCTDHARPPRPDELATAIAIVQRSGVEAALGPLVDSVVGRKRSLSLLGLLVAIQLNALERKHKAEITDIAAQLNALSDSQRRGLGIRAWDSRLAYERVDRLFNKVIHALRTLEAEKAGAVMKLQNRVARAGIPSGGITSRARAIDGTDLETCGVLQGDVASIALDGDADGHTVQAGPRGRPKTPAKVLGIGPDGRNVYTSDPDARAGHRSATGSRNAGPYIGYELHIACQTSEVKWTNGTNKIVLGDPVPSYVTGFVLTPAGTHRGKTACLEILDEIDEGDIVKEVIVDPGYSQSRPEHFAHPLMAAGVRTTFKVSAWQRGSKPFHEEALLIDGQLYSTHLPEELRDLPVPPIGASTDERRRSELAHDERARYRFVLHTPFDADLFARFKCPFCAGLVWARENQKRPRPRSGTAALTRLRDGRTTCCDHQTMTVGADEIPYWQEIPFGTTAHTKAMGRRQVIEKVNSELEGGLCDLGRKFMRVFTTVRRSFLLAFTLAAYNVECARSFAAKYDAGSPTPKVRAPRRRTIRGSASTAAGVGGLPSIRPDP